MYLGALAHLDGAYGSEPGMVGQPGPVSRLCLDLRSGLVARARNPVLLDDEPTVVAARRELGKEPVEVDVPGAELAEDAPAPRLVPRVGGPKNGRGGVRVG